MLSHSIPTHHAAGATYGEDTYLVTGGTGKTGRRVAASLRAAGYRVRAVSRSTDIPFDWADPDTWDAALDGVGGIFVVAADLQDPATTDQLKVFGTLAVRYGATRACMASVPNDGSDQFAQIHQAETALASTGLALTVLRLRWLAQTFSEDFLRDSVLAGEFRLPAGSGGEAFIDAADIADVAATVLTTEGHGGRDYEMTGPRALTFTQVADELSSALHTPITYTPITREQYIDDQEQTTGSRQTAELIADLYTAIAAGDLQTTTDHVKDVLGRPARDFHDFVQHEAAAGTWRR